MSKLCFLGPTASPAPAEILNWSLRTNDVIEINSYNCRTIPENKQLFKANNNDTTTTSADTVLVFFLRTWNKYYIIYRMSWKKVYLFKKIYMVVFKVFMIVKIFHCLHLVAFID